MADSITITLNVQDRGTPIVKKFGEVLGSVFGKGAQAAQASAKGMTQAMQQTTQAAQQGSQAAKVYADATKAQVAATQLAVSVARARVQAAQQELSATQNVAGAEKQYAKAVKESAVAANLLATALKQETTAKKNAAQAATGHAQAMQSQVAAFKQARLGAQQLTSATAQATSQTNAHASATQKASQQTQGFNTHVGKQVPVLRLLAAALAAIGLGKLIGDTIATAQRMEALQLSMQAAAGSAKAGAAEFQFVRDESERLGLELMSTADSYKGLLAAVTSTNKPIEHARTIFTGFGVGMRALSMSNEAMTFTFRALGQIMTKGTIQAEELKQQLGDHLPGAMGLLAESAKMSTTELEKMMKAGDLSADMLVGMAETMAEKYGTLAEVMAVKSVAAANRLKNTFTELKAAIGQGGLLDAVTIVTNALRDLVKRFAETDAAKRIGGVFKELAENLRALGEKWGPMAVDTFVKIVEWVSNQAPAAFFAFRKSVEGAITAVVAGLNHMLAGVQGTLSAISAAVGWLAQKAADAAAALGKEDLAKDLNRAAVEARNFADSMEKAAGESIKRRDEWVGMFTDVNTQMKNLKNETGFTAAQLRTLGNGWVIVDGAAVKAGEAMEEAVKGPQDETKKTTGLVDELARSFAHLKEKSGAELQTEALKSADALRKIADSGTESKERMSKLFQPVAKEMIEAFGSSSMEVKQFFTDMKMATGVDLSAVSQQGADTAQSLTDNFNAAGNNMSTAIGTAADKMIEKLSATQQRAEMLTKQSESMTSTLDAFADAFRGTSLEYGTTIEELNAQLIETQRERAKVWESTNNAWARGWGDYTRDILDQTIGEIQSRINELHASSDSGGGTSGGFDSGTHRTNSGRGRTGGGASFDDSIVLGGSSGAGGPNLPIGTGRVSSMGGGSGAGTVIIEGAQFQINQTGIDPRALDARGLVRAMLPALREEVRRGELNVGVGQG